MLADVAADHVFGPPGTPGRPRGIVSLDTIQEVLGLCSEEFSTSTHHRWGQFCQIWANAGWNRKQFMYTADSLRPLLYGFGLYWEDCKHVNADQMRMCIARYCHAEGSFSQLGLSYLNDFLDIAIEHFSSSETVLVPAADVSERLDSMVVSRWAQDNFAGKFSDRPRLERRVSI